MMIKNILVLVSVLTLITSCKDVQKEYYENGNIESEIEVKDNMKNGVAKWYYINGKLNFEANYVNDKEEGELRKFYEDGILNTVAFFKEGLQDGDFIEYYHDGNLKSEQFFTKGIQDKEFKSYYLNGQLSMYAILEMDETVYFIKYDSLGNWIDEFRWIEVNIEDTIILGGNYDIILEIAGPEILVHDSAVCAFVIIETEGEKEIENKLFYVKDNTISFSFTAKEVGQFFYSGIVLTNEKNKKKKNHKIEYGNFYVIDKAVN